MGEPDYLDRLNLCNALLNEIAADFADVFSDAVCFRYRGVMHEIEKRAHEDADSITTDTIYSMLDYAGSA